MDIKFRVWDEDLNKFHYWGFTEKGVFTGIPTRPGKGIDYVAKKSEQFTGLTDKNGVEIYDGDILSFDDNGGLSEWWEGIVQWESYGWQCIDRWDLYNNVMWIDDLQNDSVVDGIIIGNIHEEDHNE